METIDKPVADQAANTQSDAELVDCVRRGDVSAFESIMRRYNQRMFRIARSIVKSDVEAMDVIQDAYVRAYTHIDSLNRAGALAIWLGRIVRNGALLKLRQNQRSVSMDEEKLQTVVAMSSYAKQSAQPEEIVARHQLRQLLEQLVDTLPGDFRSTFMLRAVEGASVKETADILEIPEATVKTRFFRAKKILCKQLNEQLIERGISIHEFASVRCDTVVYNVLQRISAPAVRL